MAPSPQETGRSAKTERKISLAADLHLRAVLSDFQRLKPFQNETLEIRPEANFQMANLQVVGLIFDPLGEQIEVIRPVSGTKGRTATAVHLVVNNTDIEDTPENQDALYAIGRPYGEGIDFYPLKGGDDCPEVNWGHFSRSYLINYFLPGSSEPKREKRDGLVDQSRGLFLKFDSPVSLENLDSLVGKINSLVPSPKQRLAISDGIQAGIGS